MNHRNPVALAAGKMHIADTRGQVGCGGDRKPWQLESLPSGRVPLERGVTRGRSQVLAQYLAPWTHPLSRWSWVDP